MAGQGYTSPLTSGLTVLPSATTFSQYAIQAGTNVLLAWPVDNVPGNSTVVSLLNSIQPLGSGCSIQMPPALNTSLGEKGLFFNAGSNPVNLLDNAGNTIVQLTPGTAWFIALTNNLTTGGSWLVFQFGAGTSAANAAALAGAGLAASGALIQQIMAVATISTNYTISANDRDNLLNWTGGSGALTLPLAATTLNNFYVQVRNSGSGSLTITPSGSDLVNGLASLTMNVSDSCFLVTDGVGWFTIGLGTINTNIFNFQIVSLAGQTGTYVLPSNQQNKVAYRFTGALAGNTNIQVPSTVQQYWVDNETSGGSLGIGTSAQIGGATQFIITPAARFILYCDGSNVLNASTSGIGVPIQISQGGTGATTANNALTNLGGTSVGVAVFTAATAANAQASLGVLSASDAWAISLAT